MTISHHDTALVASVQNKQKKKQTLPTLIRLLHLDHVCLLQVRASRSRLHQIFQASLLYESKNNLKNFRCRCLCQGLVGGVMMVWGMGTTR